MHYHITIFFFVNEYIQHINNNKNNRKNPSTTIITRTKTKLYNSNQMLSQKQMKKKQITRKQNKSSTLKKQYQL